MLGAFEPELTLESLYSSAIIHIFEALLRQVIQHQKSGEIVIEELPTPVLRGSGVLVRNAFSLISAGTERSSVATAQASMLGKARSRPDLVRQVLDNVKRDGLAATIEKVQNRLDAWKELGYSCAGVVVESSCDEFTVGDRVACGGVGYASHAEVVYVPKNLAVKVPGEVSLEEAAFTTVASIAMQGVRQADVRVGERVVVTGLGLIGLITAQILKASGCAVMGLDVSERNFQLARHLGCDECAIGDFNSVAKVEAFTRGHGADAVIITAATKSSEPVELAMQYARKRGRVVVVGAVGMEIPRSPFYEKEIDFRISCSYGPGRYDSEYEEKGNDYPVGHVRWTENRNMESALDLMAAHRLDVKPLITHTFPVEDALSAYDIITGKVVASYLGILISYPETRDEAAMLTRRRVEKAAPATRSEGEPVLGVIGAGLHTQGYLLPPLKKLGARLEIVATSKPVNANAAAKKFGFAACATDASEVIADPKVNTVIIGTRHDSHGRYVLDALRAGKHVFVEKPLTISEEELEEIVALYRFAAEQGGAPVLMVGHNRRFSPAMRAIREHFSGVAEPLIANYRVNAGFIPRNSWVQDSAQGGRILGEVGHFVDSLQYITGGTPVSVYAIAPVDVARRYNNDNVSVEIAFDNGSVGHITYVANGAPAMPKEHVEVFGGCRAASMTNFQQGVFYSGRSSATKKFGGDKGHSAEMHAFLESVRTGKLPVSFESVIATTRVTFAIHESLRSGNKIYIN